MSNFKISKERIAEASNVIVQFLRDAGYEGSLEDGTGINDVVIKPNAVVYELMSQLADKTLAYQSLASAQQLKTSIGEEEYDSAVDSIMSNWFVSRGTGKPIYGVVRMWFMKPMSFVQFNDGDTVATISTTAEYLVSDGDQVFTEEDFSMVYNTTNNADEFYIDVVVRSSKFSETVLDENSAIQATFKDIYFLRGTVPGTFTRGILKESSDDFINRTKKAITTRELITDRAITTVLMDRFDTIIRLYVARHGSKEQMRDIVFFQGVSVHVGNKADIYIASEITRQTINVLVGADGTIDTAQLPVSTTICSYVEATRADGTTTPLLIEADEKTYSAFGYPPTRVVCPEITAQERITLTLLTDPVLRDIHEYVFSETQRVVCYDPIVKHMHPLMLSIVIDADLVNSKENSVPDIIRAVRDYVDIIVKANSPWVASELVAHVHNSVPNVKKINLPVQCTGKLLNPSTGTILTFEVGNKFSVDENLDTPHSQQVSSETTQFYTDTTMITVRVV